MANAAVGWSKTWIIHKHNIRIKWKFENKLLLCIITELRRKKHVGITKWTFKPNRLVNTGMSDDATDVQFVQLRD